MKLSRASSFAVCLVLLLVACGDDPAPSCDSVGNDEPASTKEAKLCVEYGVEVAKASEPCGEACGTAFKNFASQVSPNGQGCQGISQVRDETALRRTCFPAIRKASCSQLKQGPAAVSEACAGQLLP